MYEPVLLEKTVIEDPVLFPDAAAEDVLMFLGAKQSLCPDERVRDVRQSLLVLQKTIGWVKKGMPDEGRGEYVRPADIQIEQARQNTLNAIYYNPKVQGLYIHCRRSDVDSLFEAADKAATLIAGRTGLQSLTGEFFHLCRDEDGLSFRNAQLHKPTFMIDGDSEISGQMRDMTMLAKSFAVASRLFYPSFTEALPNPLFSPHVPVITRSMLCIPAEDRHTLTYDFNEATQQTVMEINIADTPRYSSRIITLPTPLPGDRYSQSEFLVENREGEILYQGPITQDAFRQNYFGPLMSHALATYGDDVVMKQIERFLDIIDVSNTSGVSRTDFIRNWVPSI